MYQSLYVTLRTGFRNPSKLQLVNMINLIHKTDPKSTTSVNYLIIDNSETIQAKKVNGIVMNMKILNHLSCVNYQDVGINIDGLMDKFRQ